jgi:hypothetical protein
MKFSGGLESRKSETSGERRQRNPVYNATLQYAPYETTSVSISASQRIASSYFANQTTKNINWGLSLQQRLASRFYASAGISNGRTTYVSTTTFNDTGRDDKYQALNIGLSTSILRCASVSISYQRSKNTSSSALYAFTSNLYGFDLTYSF